MSRYIPVGWTEHELIAQLAYERSKSPLIDQLCRRFEEYLDECDVEMLTLKLEAKYSSRLQEINNCITASSDCPICSAELSLHIDTEADKPFSLLPYSKDNSGHSASLVSLLTEPE